MSYISTVVQLQDHASNPNLGNEMNGLATRLGFNRLSYYWETPYTGSAEFSQVLLGRKESTCFGVFHGLSMEDNASFEPNPAGLPSNAACQAHWEFMDLNFETSYLRLAQQMSTCMEDCQSRYDQCDLVLGGFGQGGNLAALLSFLLTAYDPYVIGFGSSNVLYDTDCSGINKNRYFRFINTDSPSSSSYGVCFDSATFYGAGQLQDLGRTIVLGLEPDSGKMALSGAGQLLSLPSGAFRTSVCSSANDRQAYQTKLEQLVVRNPSGVTPVGFSNGEYCEVTEDCRANSVCLLPQGEKFPQCTERVTETPSPTRSPTTPPPTEAPTSKPTATPTPKPSNIQIQLTWTPSGEPTPLPTTVEPTWEPTLVPTTNRPTREPTREPTTDRPTREPTREPTTEEPTVSPTELESDNPTVEPTAKPTESPTRLTFTVGEVEPWVASQMDNTDFPTLAPTLAPTTNTDSVPTVVNVVRPSQGGEEEIDYADANDNDGDEDATNSGGNSTTGDEGTPIEALPLHKGYFRVMLVLKDVTTKLGGFTVFLWEDETSDHIQEYIQNYTVDENWDPPMVGLRVQANIVTQTLVPGASFFQNEADSTTAVSVIAGDVADPSKRNGPKHMRQLQSVAPAATPMAALEIVFEVAISYRTLNTAKIDLQSIITDSFQSPEGRKRYATQLRDTDDPTFDAMSDFALRVEDENTPNAIQVNPGDESGGESENKVVVWSLVGAALVFSFLTVTLIFVYVRRARAKRKDMTDYTISNPNHPLDQALNQAKFEPASSGSPLESKTSQLSK